MKVYIVLIVFSICCLIMGCGPSQKDFEEDVFFIHLDGFQELNNSQIRIEEAIFLETNQNNLMGFDLKVLLSDSGIFIMDQSLKNGIHIFDKNGAYEVTHNLLGEGPGQLRAINDFHVDNKGDLTILSSIGSASRILKYSQQEGLKEMFSVDYSASSFIALANGHYLLYGGYNLPFIEYRIVEVDKGEIVGKHLKNDYKNNMLPMTERNFFQSQEQIFILESFNNRIYKYEDGEIKSVMQADFEKYAIPDKFWEMDLMEGFQMISQNGFANFRNVFSGNNIYLADIMYQKGRDVYKNILFIDEQSGKRYKIKGNLSDETLYYYPIGIDEMGRAMFVTYASILQDYLTKNPGLNKHIVLPKEELDYPVILKVSLDV